MPTIDPIPVEGLRDLARQLRQVGGDAPKAMRLAANKAADIVVHDAQQRTPKKSGKAAKSIKAKSTKTAARITSGGRTAPYMPWLDYGGKVGVNKSVERPFQPDGRYVYPAFRSNREKVEETYLGEIDRIIKDAGLESN